MLIITFSLTAAINNAINKWVNYYRFCWFSWNWGYVKLFENFLGKTKFLKACFVMAVSGPPSYETTHTEQECDLSCVDRFNLQRYFTRRLWTGLNIYFAMVIAHSAQSGREMIIRKFSNSYSRSAMLWILTIIVVHVIHDSVSHSVIQLCSRNHDPTPRCLLRPWLYSRNGDWISAMARIPFPHLSSFVTINIGGDTPITIQTHLTQTETHGRRSYQLLNKTERIKMWWIETENYDVVILGQLWSKSSNQLTTRQINQDVVLCGNRKLRHSDTQTIMTERNASSLPDMPYLK